MQKYDKDSFFMPNYDDMLRGIHISPEQSKELKNLYSRATLPVRPYSYVFAGILTADFLGMILALDCYVKTGDKKIVAGGLVLLLAQLISAVVLGYRMQSAEKQLYNKINEIKIQNNGR